MGRFNLEVSSDSPFNVFMSPELQELMDFQGRVNVMLVAESPGAIRCNHGGGKPALFCGRCRLEGKLLEGSSELQITSERVFIDESLSEPL